MLVINGKVDVIQAPLSTNSAIATYLNGAYKFDDEFTNTITSHFDEAYNTKVYQVSCEE